MQAETLKTLQKSLLAGQETRPAETCDKESPAPDNSSEPPKTGDGSEPAHDAASEIQSISELDKLVQDGAQDDGAQDETTTQAQPDSVDPVDPVAAQDYLQQLANTYDDDERQGDKVVEHLAALVNKMLGKKLAKVQLDTKLGKYKRPLNCGKMVCPKVNWEIWKNLDQVSRDTDRKLQEAQELIQKGMVAIVRVADALLAARAQKTSVDLQRCIEMQMDAVVILANANVEACANRKELINQCLRWPYTQLIYSKEPVTDQLFGEDIPKQLKTLKETNTLTRNLTTNNRFGGGRSRSQGGPRAQYQDRQKRHNSYDQSYNQPRNFNNSSNNNARGKKQSFLGKGPGRRSKRAGRRN
jgi:hypothetical protein